MMIRRSLLTSFLALAFASGLLADQHPNIARGFDIGKPYQMTDLDNVNIFNGNLTVTLPIGQRYKVNGALEYGLTLVYSGNIWDIDVIVGTIPCSSQLVKKSFTNRRTNAGLGWTVSLGRLFEPNVYPTQESGAWQYETPDGGLHGFNAASLHRETANLTYLYTTDGSYFRLHSINSSPPVQVVELPDGTRQTFAQRWSPAGGAEGGWCDRPTGCGAYQGWRLISTSDRFGNELQVSYESIAATQDTPAYPEVWSVYEPAKPGKEPRTQKVYFEALPGGTHATDVRLAKAVLTTFGGVPARRTAGQSTTCMRGITRRESADCWP